MLQREFFGDDLGEAGADFVGVGLGGGLGHHAHERFGAGGAQQHTAGVSQQFLLAGHGILDALVGGGGLLVHVRHVDEGLRQLREVGDGTLTALTLCNEVVKSGKSLKQLAADFPQLPQQLVNVPNVDKMAATTNAAVQAAVDKESKLLGDTGRVLLRPSGTEPLVRVMAEAATQQQADEVCDRLAKVVADELAL